MFDFRLFLKEGFLNAVGKMDDYKIQLNASEWRYRGVLEDGDLAEIQAAIENQKSIEKEENTEEPVEE